MSNSCFKMIQAGVARSRALSFLGIRVEAMITGSLAKTHVEQRFVNEGAKPIEIIYEFPLPLGGILLQLNIVLGDRALSGLIKGKTSAESDYEEAIVGGDSAFLLRELRPGLQQINLGNLLPGEKSIISLDYVEVLDPVDSNLRYRLPTVIAPHYGNPAEVGLEPQDVPASDLAAEYPMEVRVTIRGGNDLAGQVTSPSHRITAAVSSEDLILQLEGEPEARTMDRDFIVMIPQREKVSLSVWQQAYGDKAVVLGILSTPALPSSSAVTPLTLTILIDCSGSMAGDSIYQARMALSSILDRLDEQDRIAILCFGTEVKPWMDTPVVATDMVRATLRARSASLNADLGGTEIGTAIEHALRITPEGGQILLVTDGESYLTNRQLTDYSRKGRRFFTVGVGSSVSELVVQELASQSQGFCELVTPNEDMHTRIVQQLVRMRQSQQSVSVTWGGVIPELARVPQRLFLGETLLFSAVLPNKMATELELTLSDGERATHLNTWPVPPIAQLAGDFSRIVAWHQLPLMGEEDAEEYAVAYQLLTDKTAMVAVLTREEAEQSDGLPDIIIVPQMLATGWGGAGSVFTSRQSRLFDPDSNIQFSRRQVMSSSCEMYLDAPAMLRRSVKSNDLIGSDAADNSKLPQNKIISPRQLIDALNAMVSPSSLFTWKKAFPDSIDQCIDTCLKINNLSFPPELEQLVEVLGSQYLPEMTIISRREIILKLLISFLREHLNAFRTRQYRALSVAMRNKTEGDRENALLYCALSKELTGTTTEGWRVNIADS